MTSYTDFNALFNVIAQMDYEAREIGGDIAYLCEILGEDAPTQSYSQTSVSTLAQDLEQMVDGEFHPDLATGRALFYPKVGDYFIAGPLLTESYNYLVEGLQLGVFFSLIDCSQAQKTFGCREALRTAGFRVYSSGSQMHQTAAELYQAVKSRYEEVMDAARP